MQPSHRRIVIDIDGVLARKHDVPYSERELDRSVLDRIVDYRGRGFDIVLHTARNMRTHEGRIGRINAETAPILVDWLDEHAVPYDEIHYGKPWCGSEGFYVDDKAVRPDEFLAHDHGELRRIVEAAER